MFDERRFGEEVVFNGMQGSNQVVPLLGMVSAFEIVNCKNLNVVFGINPANFLMCQKKNIFCNVHKLKLYY
ncbi:hypothetical protein, partial [Anaerostipes hadrus]|uniref:hypothetical protein n=1 Tax=Anaerostipes hadrus TaxID=649756 RepID=UPI001ADDD14B